MFTLTNILVIVRKECWLVLTNDYYDSNDSGLNPELGDFVVFNPKVSLNEWIIWASLQRFYLHVTI